jgi:DNA repair protein RadC
MPQSEDTIAVNVVVEMTTASLKAIVENAKRLSGRNEKGHYTVDTADKVSEMISRFLLEKDFEHFVKTAENYQ